MEQLTSKEVGYLSESMEFEKNEQEKFDRLAGGVQNAQLANTLRNLAQMHKNHFEQLKKYIPGATATH